MFGKQEKSLLLSRLLRYLLTFRSPSWLLYFLSLESFYIVILTIFAIFVTGVFGKEENPCYFCDFFDICGHFGALLRFFFFKVLNLVTFVILVIFATFIMTVSAIKKILVTFTIFANISGPFLASLFSKS